MRWIRIGGNWLAVDVLHTNDLIAPDNANTFEFRGFVDVPLVVYENTDAPLRLIISLQNIGGETRTEFVHVIR